MPEGMNGPKPAANLPEAKRLLWTGGRAIGQWGMAPGAKRKRSWARVKSMSRQEICCRAGRMPHAGGAMGETGFEPVTPCV